MYPIYSQDNPIITLLSRQSPNLHKGLADFHGLFWPYWTGK